MNPKVTFEPVPNAAKITSPNDLIKHLNSHQRLEGLDPDDLVIIGAGSNPKAEDRGKVIFTRDDSGELAGPFRWEATGGDGDDCCNTGQLCCIQCDNVGELRTFVRTADTMAEEKEKGRFLCGWKLADGADNSVGGDLTANAGFFTGASPDWDVYTVVFEG